MKVGDLVMFSNASSKYAQWFLGEFATVISLSESSCRVRWKRPISYFDSKTVVSDFPRTSFTHLG
jgi:hypothetical protein